MDLSHAIESAWKGSEESFDGPHHDFCYVCGGSMELFGCRTCNTSYHASCMSPTLEPNEVPPFWYCPHCVDRDMHILQAESPTTAEFSPSLENNFLYPSPSSIEMAQNHSVSTTASEASGPQRASPAQQLSSIGEGHRGGTSRISGPASLSRKQNLKSIDHIQNLAASHPKTQPATRQPKRKYSPPRKRSKYSSLSSEVDKALAVIQKELETAAKVGKSEDSLRDKIQDLEQQLKLKDGQIILARRELELARNSSGQAGPLKSEIADLKAQNAVLHMEVEKKDRELRDWREKLKTLLGAEMNIA